MALRVNFKHLLVLIPVLFLVSFCTYHGGVFTYFAWLQDYEKFSVLHTEAVIPQNESHLVSQKVVVPKIIHQMWKDANVPAQWQTTRAMCKRMYGEFQHRLWTDASMREFLGKEYPWFLSVYDSYPYDIQRADAARYFILHHFGGVYLDLDVGCFNNMRRKLLKYPMLLPVTEPVGISNDVMVAIPRHPFLLRVISELHQWNHFYGSPFLTVFLSTGPAFLSYQAGVYLQEQKGIVRKQKKNTLFKDSDSSLLYFLDRELYAFEGDNALFYHIPGSSWHSLDAKVLGFIYNNHLLVIFGVTPLCICIVYFCGLFRKNSRCGGSVVAAESGAKIRHV